MYYVLFKNIFVEKETLYLRKILTSCIPVVIICAASDHYMYRTVVTLCTAQWSLYVPDSGHYMYSTVVTIRTAQWSLYVPHSGHYMYRTVVTICTAQWSLYVPHSGHYMNHQFNIHNFTFCPHSIFVLCGSQNKQRLFPYTTLNDWFV